MADHISHGLLEEYSLGNMAESSLAAVEEHLLICDDCRRWLEVIEPVNYVHFTEDWPVYSRATMLTTGKVTARHWGKNLDCGRECENVSAARKYLSESFFQMFPDHICKGKCGPTRQQGNTG